LAGGHQWHHHRLRVGGIALEVWYSLRQVWLALLGSCIVGQTGAWSRDRLGRRSSGSGIFVSRSFVTSCSGKCRRLVWCMVSGLVCSVYDVSVLANVCGLGTDVDDGAAAPEPFSCGVLSLPARTDGSLA
jgi:hypothetical protein